MHVVIIFHNLGGYHIARLRAAQKLLAEKHFTLTAIQETASAGEHPWGSINQKLTFPLITLIPSPELNQLGEINPQSPIAAQRLPPYLDKIKPDIIIIPGWGFPIARAALTWAH
ncbi:hypothetical protein [Synechocystis salina]|uniref:hypothetical protein n=1 Tax=Synechocystis salina TaxID=945780 RepID=UPI001D13DEE4|nr:hypothetical protein [Synechocystis salina]